MAQTSHQDFVYIRNPFHWFQFGARSLFSNYPRREGTKASARKKRVEQRVSFNKLRQTMKVSNTPAQTL